MFLRSIKIKYLTTSITLMTLASVAFAQSTETPTTFSQGFAGASDADSASEGLALKGSPDKPNQDPRDFNGLWKPGVTPRRTPLKTLDDAFTLEEPPLTKRAQDFVRMIRSKREKGFLPSLSTHACRSPGVYTQLFPAFVIGVIQTDEAMFQLFELPRLVRKIHIGENFPKHIEPSYVGYSIGHWEGDTLVVETKGYNGLGELDITGAPVSKNTRMYERYTKAKNGKHINISIKVEDPEYLTEPLEVERQWVSSYGTQHGEYDCEESPREDMEGHTYYYEDLYVPVCVRKQGKGTEPSKVVCNYQP